MKIVELYRPKNTYAPGTSVDWHALAKSVKGATLTASWGNSCAIELPDEESVGELEARLTGPFKGVRVKSPRPSRGSKRPLPWL